MARIAFLVQAHADPEHLRRLCRILAPHDVFVHWDAKSGPPPEVPGAQVITARVPVFWAGFSQVTATVELIRAALGTGKAYDKLVLLSGSCYPIRPIAELEALFAQDGGRNYLNAIRVAEADFLVEQTSCRIWRDAVLPLRLRRSRRVLAIERHLRAGLNLGLRLLPRRNPPFALYHGSQWWCLTPAAAAHALAVYDERTDLRRFFAFTFASDEKFFHSVLRNSGFAESCGPALPYTGRGTYKTANLHIIDPSLAKWCDEDDIPLVKASDKFFLRKVRSGTSDRLLDWIDINRLSCGAGKEPPHHGDQ